VDRFALQQYYSLVTWVGGDPAKEFTHVFPAALQTLKKGPLVKRQNACQLSSFVGSAGAFHELLHSSGRQGLAGLAGIN
jgi:hypothetical protein